MGIAVIERALESARPAIESLLLANGLPLDGLEMAMPTAVVAREADGLVGARIADWTVLSPATPRSKIRWRSG